jgi:hypothetical protein
MELKIGYILCDFPFSEIQEKIEEIENPKFFILDGDTEEILIKKATLNLFLVFATHYCNKNKNLKLEDEINKLKEKYNFN